MTARAPTLLVALVASTAISAATGAAAASSPFAPVAIPAHSARQASAANSRTFSLPAGRAERRFLMRERAGVILLARLTVPRGVRARVDAVIPHLAGTRFQTDGLSADPSLACRGRGSQEICTQQEEWCPMPAATWYLHLVKLSGRAGPVRVDFLVAPPAESK